MVEVIVEAVINLLLFLGAYEVDVFWNITPFSRVKVYHLCK
jgi:hypothetical protein